MGRAKKQYKNLRPYQLRRWHLRRRRRIVEEEDEPDDQEEEDELDEVEDEGEENENENEQTVDISLEDNKVALQYTIALIACGFTISRIEDFDILINRASPSRKLIAKAMNVIRPYIKMLAYQSCEHWKQKMSPESIVSIDGSWNHRRRGTYEIFDVICVQLKKIIAFDIRIHKSHNIPGNTLATASAMEGESFKILLPELQQDPRICDIVKDGDVQTDKMINESGWQVHIRPDINHLMKHFDDHFKKMVPDDIRNKFKGICKYIKENLEQILYWKTTNKFKKLDGIHDVQNTILHCKFLKYGSRPGLFYWKSRKDVKCIEKLNVVIDYCKDLILEFDRGVTTNYNESFHALKAILVPKNFNLGQSTDIRLYATVLQYNEGDSWLMPLFMHFGLDPTCVERLIEFRNTRHQDKSKHDFFQEKRNQQNAQNEEDRIQHQYEVTHNIPHHH